MIAEAQASSRWQKAAHCKRGSRHGGVCADGSYMQHIAKETGANITLRGKGSGIQETEALHIFISAAIPKAFAEALKLAQNLIDTVKSEHDKQVCPRTLQAPSGASAHCLVLLQCYMASTATPGNALSATVWLDQHHHLLNVVRVIFASQIV